MVLPGAFSEKGRTRNIPTEWQTYPAGMLFHAGLRPCFRKKCHPFFANAPNNHSLATLSQGDRSRMRFCALFLYGRCAATPLHALLFLPGNALSKQRTHRKGGVTAGVHDRTHRILCQKFRSRHATRLDGNVRIGDFSFGCCHTC